MDSCLPHNLDCTLDKSSVFNFKPQVQFSALHSPARSNESWNDNWIMAHRSQLSCLLFLRCLFIFSVEIWEILWAILTYPFFLAIYFLILPIWVYHYFLLDFSRICLQRCKRKTCISRGNALRMRMYGYIHPWWQSTIHTEFCHEWTYPIFEATNGKKKNLLGPGEVSPI